MQNGFARPAFQCNKLGLAQPRLLGCWLRLGNYGHFIHQLSNHKLKVRMRLAYGLRVLVRG